MSNLLKQLLEEVRGGLNKTAEAPNEMVQPGQGNPDILEVSNETVAKIDNFIQQIQGMGPIDQGGQPGTGNGENDGAIVDPTNGGGTGSSVHLEVPAGMSVKLASCDPTDSDSAIKTIIGLVPSYFED